MCLWCMFLFFPGVIRYRVKTDAASGFGAEGWAGSVVGFFEASAARKPNSRLARTKPISMPAACIMAPSLVSLQVSGQSLRRLLESARRRSSDFWARCVAEEGDTLLDAPALAPQHR